MTIDGRTATGLADGEYSIEDLVDLDQLRSLFERFTAATGFTIGFLNHPELDVLIATGWRDICTVFHRNCPASMDNCTKSNRDLLDKLNEVGQLVIEPCDNGLVDCATPIIVHGKHIASLATGQVLLEKPDLERFKRQAREFGFDEAEYLKALEEIPVVDEEQLKIVTAFLGEMALVISQVGYAKLAREIEVSERLQAEANLRESEEKYRAVFEGAGEGILVADTETKEIQYANASACEMFGYSPEDWTRISVGEMHPTEALPAVIAEFEAQGRGEKVLASELPCLRKNGELFHADIATRPVVIAGRTMNVGFFNDVSARKRAEDERRNLETQLAIAQKMEAVGRLAGGVAHDFNNLLSVILGYTDFAMNRTRKGDPLRDELQQIANAGERAAALTRQLLAFSRKQAFELEPLDLNDVVSRMEKILTRTIGEDIELVCALEKDLGVIRGDRGQLEQVVMNLAINARDAMAEGGRLTIETGNAEVDEAFSTQLGELPLGAYVMLAVTDTGCGMDELTRAQIFEPFFTTKEHRKGTGLGLSTVYGIVKQSEGTIRVYSEAQRGTTFKIYLPRADEPLEVRPNKPKEPSTASGSETILVVEDDEAVRNLAARILVNVGYTVHTAADGEEALRTSAGLGGAIDLLLTDVVMPGMHGRAVAERLMETCDGIKILYMSGYTHNVILPHGVLDSGNQFLAKPFNAADLARKVREVLDANES